MVDSSRFGYLLILVIFLLLNASCFLDRKAIYPLQDSTDWITAKYRVIAFFLIPLLFVLSHWWTGKPITKI
jgi:hypothetical protein